MTVYCPRRIDHLQGSRRNRDYRLGRTCLPGKEALVGLRNAASVRGARHGLLVAADPATPISAPIVAVVTPAQWYVCIKDTIPNQCKLGHDDLLLLVKMLSVEPEMSNQRNIHFDQILGE
jgi:hypothetical protein